MSSDSSDDDELEWPERREALYTGALGLGAGTLGVLLTPIRHSQLTIDDPTYEAAKFMREYSRERGWEYPENYVFSRWGRNRVYNWFVNGESGGYGYAQSNFDDFVTASDGRQWYERLRDRAGFVVTEAGTLSGGGGDGTIYEQLWDEDFAFDTDHYRLVWFDDGDSKRVFTPVPGATVTGPAADAEVVSIDGEAAAGDRTTQISQNVDAKHGVYTETIPLPGRYEVGPQQVILSDADVMDGRVIADFEHEGAAHWSFEEGSGEWAYDRAGGRHARLHGGKWGDRGIELSGEGYLQARSLGEYTISEFSIVAWIRPETATSGGILSLGKDGGSNSIYGILFDHGLSGWNNDQLGLYVGNGDVSQYESSPQLGFSYPVEKFHRVVIVFNSGEIQWFVDDELLAEESLATSQISLPGDRPIYIGREYSGYGSQSVFRGGIDGVSYYERPLPAEEIVSL